VSDCIAPTTKTYTNHFQRVSRKSAAQILLSEISRKIYEQTPMTTSALIQLVGDGGRYKWILGARALLGDEATAMDWQIARDKDFADYEEFKKRVETLEQRVSSKPIDSPSAARDVGDWAKEILEDGYEECVLQNTVLEEKCLKIFREAMTHIEKLNPEAYNRRLASGARIADMVPLVHAKGFGYFITLNKALTTADEQKAWFILCSWLYPKWEMVANSIGALPLQAVEQAVSLTEKVLNYPSVQSIIPKDDILRIGEEIKMGITRNLELHPSK
jgi:hypothetical protein